MKKTIDSLSLQMTKLMVIKDELQYSAYLREASSLAVHDPEPDSDEGRRLELLSLLIDKYETERFPIAAPDPVEAILFRMAELGLKKKDLGELLGSQPRATEILSRKRPLSLEMIRNLHAHLSIPAEVLIARHDPQVESVESEFDWKKFPLREMVSRGWIDEKSAATDSTAAVRRFISQLSGNAMPVFLRRSVYGAADTGIREKLYAWLARVVHKAREIQPSLKKYEPGSVTPEFLLDVAKLSATDRGPLVAREYLARRGIPLIIEPALAGTKVDGATVLDDGEKPIIALSIRFDRLDNFWFTLLHELAHVSLHIEKHKSTFVDDTEAISSDDQIEQEANLLAADSFIPRTTWRYSAAPKTRAVADVLELSEQLCISPAIIAGRIRKECGNYRILQSLLGSGQVRELFPEVKWR